MKTCIKCGVEKDIELFRINRNICKCCANLQMKIWRDENKQHVRSYKSNYSKTSEKYKEKQKRKYLKYREIYNKKSREHQRIYRYENAEKVKNRQKKWIDENPEKRKYSIIKFHIKKQLGFEPPKELIEVKLLINKTKKLCKTLKN